MNWADDPIQTREQDSLERGSFVAKVVDLIEEAKSEESSIVFGLVGPWGCGKTSIINLVERQLDDSWKVCHFSPWATSDIAGLLSEFFAVLGSALPNNTKGKKAKKAIGMCARMALPLLSAVPYVGTATRDTIEGIVKHLGQEKPWIERFDNVTRQFRDLEIPILIVVDDVDRLHAEELTTLLKAVRLLGRFPGVHYLLAYDEGTITELIESSAIAGKDNERAHTFLEKIIQYPLEIPPVQSAQIEDLTNSELESLFSEYDVNPHEHETDRLQFIYQTLISRHLTTVRAVHRYIAQVRTYLSLIGPHEVDVADLLTITYIRLRFPTLYKGLSDWRDELTNRSTNLLFSNSTAEVDWDKRIERAGVSPSDRGAVKQVLAVLFPASGVNEKGLPIWSTSPRADGIRRISDPEYVDRYFYLTIPTNDIPDYVVANALAQAEHAGTELEKVRGVIEAPPSRIKQRIIQKLQRLSADIPPERVPGIVVLAASFLPHLERDYRPLGSGWRSCIEWLSDLLVRWPEDGTGSHVGVDQLLEESRDLEAIVMAFRKALEAPTSEGHDLQTMTDRLTAHVQSVIMDNISNGDEAPQKPILLYLYYMKEAGDLAELTSALSIGLESGVAPIDAIGARCVSVAHTLGVSARSELMGFDEEMFLKIVPDNWRSYIEIQPQGVADAKVDLDEGDLSWMNRRRVAHEAIRRLMTA